jgi:hypothetical protein
VKAFKYESRNAQGQVCCAGDRPDFPRCDNCRAQEPIDYRFAAKVPERPVVQPDVEALGVPGLVQRVVYDAVSERDGDDVSMLAPPDAYADALAQMKENRR